MCLAAVYWSRLEAVFYSATASDAAAAGFDDAFLYEEMRKDLGERTVPEARMLAERGMESFDAWRRFVARVDY
jgi:tRNA(Arg) A34 adenosine deaminase TadA